MTSFFENVLLLKIKKKINHQKASIFNVKVTLVRLFVFVLIIAISFSCSQEPRNQQKTQLIDRHRDMSIHRTDDMRSASIRFFSKYPAFCRIEYWKMSLGDSPDKAFIKHAPCYNSNSTTAHFVRIEKLERSSPLYIRLLASSSDSTTKRFDDSLILQETTSNYSYFPPNGYLQKSLDDPIISVIKTNLTQASATVYSNQITTSTFDLEKERFKNLNIGCRKNKISTPGAILPPIDVNLKEVSTTGYYSTRGKVVDKKRGLFLLDFTGKLEPARQWTFRMNFDNDLNQLRYSFQSPPELRSAVIDSSKPINLNNHDLTNFTSPVKIKTSQDLIIKWTAINTKAHDYVQINIGKPSQVNAIKCQYKLATKTLTIPAENLQIFKDKVVDLIFSINRKVTKKNTESNHTIFLHTHDWRYKTIKFQ